MIIAVGHPEWYGVKRALRSYTQHFLPVGGQREIVKAAITINEQRPAVVIFGCWMPEWMPVLDAARAAGAKTVLTWYASYVLNEFDVLNRLWLHSAMSLARLGKFDYVATPHQGLVDTWNHYGIPTDYLPLVVDDVMPPVTKKPGINIGIFGSAQPWKNMECQIVAAGMVPNATIWVNSAPRHNSAIQIFGIRVQRVGHIPADDDFRRLVGSMTINLCVSLSETYSYLAAESLLLGTPVLTGTITPIFHQAPAILQAFCTIDQFENPMKLADTMVPIINHQEMLAREGKTYMLAHNRRERFWADELIAKWTPKSS